VFERDRDELETILQQDAENLTRFKDTWSDVKQQLYRRSTADVFEDLIARENLKGFWNSRPNGQQRVANIEQFLDIVRDFEMRRGTEPFELLDELETKRDSSDPAAGGLAASRGADVVITTYWQAKGREWPVVVLPRIHKTSYEASYAGFGMTRIKPPESEEAAFLPELKIPDDHFETKDNKVLDELTKDLKNESARAEYKRLFYVAATRAEERLIMSGTFEPYPTSKTAKQRTWAEMLQYNINLRLDDEGIRLDEPSCWEDLDSIRLVRANEQKPPSPISSDEPKSEVDVFPERWAIYDSKPVEITGASLLDAVDSVPPPAEELSTPLPEAREESDEHATSSKPGQALH
jgi:ATP-dependent exoDNAse (exonuclease V) beta subunit